MMESPPPEPQDGEPPAENVQENMEICDDEPVESGSEADNKPDNNEICLLVKNTRIKAVKSDLVKCSPYFKAMFSMEFNQQKRTEFEIEILKPDAVEDIVKFCSGKNGINLTWNNVYDMTKAATYLQVEEAVKLCSRFLTKVIVFENAREIFEMAELFAGQT